MDILTWLIVGLVAGVLASLVAGGYGLIADIVIGIAGAFVGAWILRHLGATVPVGGLAGVIIVAFIGAVVLLVLLRIIRSLTRSSPP
ncbi:MAG TPA: GlsB/YeaQ/YmgE family stress response membrane protein [Gemmatimonadaceae bacterium]|nr:GlsB/YeaQ/YmgE family stress response membrane protein [Gemmatimonadaceae bacterium]